jgi:hypothetical protein
MSLEDFKKIITSGDIKSIVEECLNRDIVHAIPTKSEYANYINTIKLDHSSASHIAIMGSGNWCYSLNPDKKFRAFHKGSDIDIVIICEESFHQTWSDLREHHRKEYYFLSFEQKSKLKRNGENVYSGFVTPKWITDKASKALFEHELRCNNYSNKIVGYRKVNMMYFKNKIETVDYYTRGFRLALGRL